MNRIEHQFSMRDTVASQLIRDNLSGFTAIFSKQSLEKPPGSCTVASCLKKYIDHLSVLVNRSPQILLPAADLHEDFVNKECISIALVLPI
jgi:hypothetical protein